MSSFPNLPAPDADALLKSLCDSVPEPAPEDDSDYSIGPLMKALEYSMLTGSSYVEPVTSPRSLAKDRWGVQEHDLGGDLAKRAASGQLSRDQVWAIQFVANELASGRAASAIESAAVATNDTDILDAIRRIAR